MRSTGWRADPTLANVARAVDWRLLALFAGLFVVVGAAERAGIETLATIAFGVWWLS
jgi:Na+/H+ antiporter NhaD/arsenite permease-like protein